MQEKIEEQESTLRKDLSQINERLARTILESLDENSQESRRQLDVVVSVAGIQLDVSLEQREIHTTLTIVGTKVGPL